MVVVWLGQRALSVGALLLRMMSANRASRLSKNLIGPDSSVPFVFADTRRILLQRVQAESSVKAPLRPMLLSVPQAEPKVTAEDYIHMSKNPVEDLRAHTLFRNAKAFPHGEILVCATKDSLADAILYSALYTLERASPVATTIFFVVDPFDAVAGLVAPLLLKMRGSSSLSVLRRACFVVGKHWCLVPHLEMCNAAIIFAYCLRSSHAVFFLPHADIDLVAAFKDKACIARCLGILPSAGKAPAKQPQCSGDYHCPWTYDDIFSMSGSIGVALLLGHAMVPSVFQELALFASAGNPFLVGQDAFACGTLHMALNAQKPILAVCRELASTVTKMSGGDYRPLFQQALLFSDVAERWVPDVHKTFTLCAGSSAWGGGTLPLNRAVDIVPMSSILADSAICCDLCLYSSLSSILSDALLFIGDTCVKLVAAGVLNFCNRDLTIGSALLLCRVSREMDRLSGRL